MNLSKKLSKNLSKNLSTFNALKHVEHQGWMVEVSGERLLKLQQTLLGIMDDLDRVCRENGISYFLSGGTMLGAVRHHGFIPWDDDADIFMTRADYERFRALFPQELSSAYVLVEPGVTRDYGLSMVKVRKKGTALIECPDPMPDDEALLDGTYGVWVDIFILENVSDNRLARAVHGFLSMGFGFALSCRTFYSRREMYRQLAGSDKELLKTFNTKIAIGRLLSVFKLETWARWTKNVYSMCHDENSKNVVCPSGRNHFTGEIFPRHPFCDTKEVLFEDRKYFISKWYDGYLKQLYGDYMTVPEAAEQEAHVVRKLVLPEE